MFKSPLIFGVALVAGWTLLATGAITSLAGVAPIATPPHFIVHDTIEVIAPVDVADASVPNVELAPAAHAAPVRATL
ncbi:MAG: hypothetical protein AB1938_29790 [Myxococcota bacterium]